ncbi:MaoC family dehydratase [Haloferacaceae archaeon DSL9]
MSLQFEDLDTETRWELGSRTLSKAQIIDFARAYDPQPFHVDEDAGRESIFGGLIASGLHTYCACNRLATDALFGNLDFLGGMGIDELRWHRPVYPGDTLGGYAEITGLRRSKSHPERGYVDLHVVGTNQREESVISWTALGMVRRRATAEPEPEPKP